MTFDIDLIKKVYGEFGSRINSLKQIVKRPLTYAEKILYTHLFDFSELKEFKRGADYAEFHPDRVAMQDATAQMAVLQFMLSGRSKTAVPTTIHADHLITAKEGSVQDLNVANQSNNEVYNFLQSVAQKYGMGFWKAGAGIIHQVVLENYAFPGGMIIGTDSHTPNAGGLGMVAIGVGGADAVDVMAGMEWELKFPKFIGIKLTGKLNGWTAPKDIILEVARILTVKGGTGFIIEYFGEGAESLSATGKATICNMGAEVGATTSIFAYDQNMSKYLRATNRADVAELADGIKAHLRADEEVYNNPTKYYDQLIEINLNDLEPHLNGPFTPDRAWKISKIKESAVANELHTNVTACLIGSCTNSSYEDLTRAASIIRDGLAKGLTPKAQLYITPGSETIYETAKRDGLLETFQKAGAVILANACGPCIGQWDRKDADKQEPNSIITSYNRNFAKRNDGNPNTHAFVASPEMCAAFVFSGDLRFNPLKDSLADNKRNSVVLAQPQGFDLPPKGYQFSTSGFVSPSDNSSNIEINVAPNSERLQLLEPFKGWDGSNFANLRLLIKVKGKCTTDHISMAGPWLRYRGHLDHISDNVMLGAVNAFTGESNTKNPITGKYDKTPAVARFYRNNNIASIIIGDENYGEGSSREHAAMEPRHMGVKVVMVKSFARIHETNLKKQGILALTFANANDYDKIKEDDIFDFIIENFTPNKQVKIIIKHSEGSVDEIFADHSYNDKQIEWFKYGSALNLIRHSLKNN